MGADLYLDPAFKPNFEKWKGLYDEAMQSLKKSEPGSTDYEVWKKKANEYAELMYSEGYFRDSYNPSNLLWQFELSWWEDITPRLDEYNNLSVEHVEWFAEELSRREEIFEEQLRLLSPESQQYFRERYEELQVFLGAAIKMGCPVQCSL